MMDTKDLVDKLKDLMQLDIDAVKAYEQALDNIDYDEAREQLNDFRADHERHIHNLSTAILSLGGEPPERRPDMKGFLITAFTAIRSAAGTESALKAMRSNEKTMTSKYEQALEWKTTDEVKMMIRSHHSDEVRHLGYIERALAEKPWEVTPVA